jgi:hypothetical protein
MPIVLILVRSRDNPRHHVQLPKKWVPGPVRYLLSSTDEQLEGQHDDKM